MGKMAISIRGAVTFGLKRSSMVPRSTIYRKPLNSIRKTETTTDLSVWYQLFNRKPRESITASLKALELSPDEAVMINGNLAHGYLFDNQFDKAKAIYLENKDAKLHDGRAFSQAVLDDFKEFQEAGITHPDMEKIKALLTTKTQAP